MYQWTCVHSGTCLCMYLVCTLLLEAEHELFWWRATAAVDANDSLSICCQGDRSLSQKPICRLKRLVFSYEKIKNPLNLSYGKKFNKILWTTFGRYRGFLVKFPISYSVEDLIFQNLVIFGNFWNGLLLLTLCTRISAVSKAFSAT